MAVRQSPHRMALSSRQGWTHRWDEKTKGKAKGDMYDEKKSSDDDLCRVCFTVSDDPGLCRTMAVRCK